MVYNDGCVCRLSSFRLFFLRCCRAPPCFSAHISVQTGAAAECGEMFWENLSKCGDDVGGGGGFGYVLGD